MRGRAGFPGLFPPLAGAPGISPSHRYLAPRIWPVGGLSVSPLQSGPFSGMERQVRHRVPRIARKLRAPLRVIDFAADLRPAGKGAARDRLFANLARPMSPMTHLGVRCQTRGGKCQRPRQPIPWAGFLVDTDSMEVKIDPSKQKSGMM